jgi:hypothetical protein
VDQPATLATPFNLSLLALAMSLHFLPQTWPARVEFATRRMPLVLWGVVAGAAIVAIDSLGPSGVAPFIYFQF